MGQQEADIRDVKPEYYANMVKKVDNHVYDEEVATIAYWKMDTEGKFRSYRHFSVPNPMKREVRFNKETQNSLFQVLYYGRHKEIFFFYKEPDGKSNALSKADGRQMKLGILNLKVDFYASDKSEESDGDGPDGGLGEEEHFESYEIRKGSTLDAFITELNKVPVQLQNVIPNPSLFSF